MIDRARTRILLVNAATDEREMYAQWLQRNGYSTLQATNAADAYRLASELAPAAVVTDVRLGGTEDGLTLTRRLKGDALTRGVPVLMLTAQMRSGDREAAARAGCDRFLTKPCLPDTLERVITSVLAIPA